MAVLMRRFSARARSGINPGEATRREEAVRHAGETVTRQFPPSLISERLKAAETSPTEDRFRALPAFLRTPVAPPLDRPEAEVVAADQAEPDQMGAASATIDPAPVAPRIITITISGLPHIGKTDAVYLVRHAITNEGFPVDGPDPLYPRRWRKNLDRLARQGLRFVIVEEIVEQPGEQGGDPEARP